MVHRCFCLLANIFFWYCAGVSLYILMARESIASTSTEIKRGRISKLKTRLKLVNDWPEVARRRQIGAGKHRNTGDIMKKIYFLIATLLIITSIFYRAWSVSANANYGTNQTLGYPPPGATSQPADELGTQFPTISMSVQNTSCPAPESPLESQSLSTTTTRMDTSYPPPASGGQPGSVSGP